MTSKAVSVVVRPLGARAGVSEDAVSEAIVEAVSRPIAALGWMLLACLLFAVMNLCVKRATFELPWHEAAAGRALFGAVTVFSVARVRGVALAVHDRGSQWRRTIAGIAAMACGFFAVSRLPIGDAVTIGNLSPLFIAVGAHFFLRERASSSLVVALLLGFAGVALVAGAHLGGVNRWGSIVTLATAVVGAVCSAAAMMFLRRLGPRESAEGVSLHFLAWSTVAMLAIGVGHHALPSPFALMILALAGLTGGLAQVAMTRAYGLDHAARVGAIGYSGVVLTQALGVIFLREIPSWRQLAGAALVVASGLVLVASAVRTRRLRGRAGMLPMGARS